MTTNDRKPNRLASEKSPYLLQHAHNPVNWYPWNEEAFEKAKREDKPIFLSIGYSTCHWCHVMERESFEDADVAGYLNKRFVSIKVDREERPDIDAVYMRITQALTGQGGWPMTVFLTPDKMPFYAGTYFPKDSRYGRTGLMDILAAIEKLWVSDRDKLVRHGTEIISKLDVQKSRAHGSISKSDLTAAHELFRRGFDSRYGGFGPAPKFPTPHNLMFLLRHYHNENDAHTLDMTETTLKAMYRGGLFDHIGGGFSRYATDARWLVPHFEKMLYDNALLVISYIEAYQVTGNELYRQIIEKTLRYIVQEMTHPEGGFYSAQDADSDGAEGKFYVCRPDTIKELLGPDNGEFFCRWFDIAEAGNFEGASIPNLLVNDAYEKTDERIESMLPEVYAFRAKRTELFKDKKVLTAWNSLMIAAFSKAYRVLGHDSYRRAAERAAAFINEKLTSPEGRLHVRWHDDQAAGTGYLDDYAFTAWAMLQLYNATFDATYLETAIGHAETMCRLFEDRDNGGFFMYADDSEQLVLRPKETYDGAIPSGNAVAGYVLISLSRMTAEEKWIQRANAQLSFLAGAIKDYPSAHCFALMAAQMELYPSREIVITTDTNEDIERFIKATAKTFAPNTAVLVKTFNNEDRLTALAPFTKDYPVTVDKTHYYICENNICSAPVERLDELHERLFGYNAPSKS